MRKLLLATSAVLGASMSLASYADAQSVNNADTADNLGAMYNSAGDNFATPGSVTVRLNGRFRFFAGVNSFTGALRKTAFTGVGAAATTTGVTTTTTNAGNGPTTLPIINNANIGYNKIANYGVGDYARLYPGFDGVAANGLKYGASLEIRQDNTEGAGGGIYGSVSQTSRTRNELYFRREWGYVGTDQFGTVRVGSADGPTTLYETGTFENFDQGNFNGDAPYILPGAAQLQWPFPDAGGYYSNTKIVYLSPQFYGFDGGVSYEPGTATGGEVTQEGCAGNNNIGVFVGTGGNSVASPGCDALSSTSTGDYSRRRNTFEALLRYRGTFGPVGLATTGSIQHSGRVLYDGTAPAPGSLATNNGVVAPAGYLASPQYEDLNIGEFGLVLTYGGLQVGGNAMYGHFNTSGTAGGAGNNLSPKGAPQSLAFVIGTSYAIGPVIFGISYVDSNTPGDTTGYNFINPVTHGRVANQRREQGIDVGATYTLAPGVSLFAVYQIDQRKQNGFNFVTNSGTNTTTATVNPLDGCAGAGAACANPNVHSKIQGQVFSLGSSFAW